MPDQMVEDLPVEHLPLVLVAGQIWICENFDFTEVAVADRGDAEDHFSWGW